MAAQAKSERLMNLVICLLVSRGFVPKSRIRQVVGGYGDQSDEAFERMFERDKDELRDLGIPIETGSGGAFEDEPGYRIRRTEYELPPIAFEPDEAAVIGLAARVWQQAGLAEATSQALLKLRAAGFQTDQDALAAIEPRIAAEEPAFLPLWEAVRDRRMVEFDYRGGRDAAPAPRRLQPWAIRSWHGRWYVVGHDLDRDAPRLFRLSRIAGPVRAKGPAGAYEIPPVEVVRQAASALAPPETTGVARVHARHTTANGLRRRSGPAEPGSPGWDVLTVPYADAFALAEEIAMYGPDVVAVDPPEVRALVIAHLRSTAGGPA